MRHYILKTTGARVQGPGNLNPATSGDTIKLATLEPLEVMFLAGDGSPELLPTGILPFVGIKEVSHYDDVFIVRSTPLSPPDDASGFYTGTLDCNTVEFKALLQDVDYRTTIELDSVPLMGEWVYPVAGSTIPKRSLTFRLTGLNRVVTGNEAVPTNSTLPYPPRIEIVRNLPAVHAPATGSGPIGLNHVLTEGLETGTLVSFSDTAGVLNFWRLIAGPKDPAAGDDTQVEPGDYAPAANNKHWQIQSLPPSVPPGGDDPEDPAGSLTDDNEWAGNNTFSNEIRANSVAYIGPDARLLPTNGGMKLQVRPHGSSGQVPWEDRETFNVDDDQDSSNRPSPSGEAGAAILHVLDDGAKRALSTEPTPAVVVAGGTQYGVYPKIDVGIFQLLGGTEQLLNNLANVRGNPEPWAFVNGDGDTVYYNPADTPEPPAFGWLNASDDSPASITVTPTTIPGIKPGDYVVIDQEGGRIERFVPAGGAATTMVVSGGTLSGAYPQSGVSGRGEFGYGVPGQMAWESQRLDAWSISNPGGYEVYYSPDDVATPDLCLHWYYAVGEGEYGADDPAAITVTRHDEANQDNWIVERNTVRLSVYPSLVVTINGVSCTNYQTTDVGWVRPDSVQVQNFYGSIFQIRYGGANATYSNVSIACDGSYSGSIALPALPPRQADVIIQVGNGG